MSKKIIVSLITLGVIATIAVGGTIAYFSDVEKSTGNILVAGDVDLKVDHTWQIYNGIDCKTCDLTLISDNVNNAVSETAANAVYVGSTPVGQAMFPSSNGIHPAWTAQNDPLLVAAGAKWIWATDPTRAEDTYGTTYTFTNKFDWFGPIENTDIWMAVGSDNSVEVYLNTVKIGENSGEFGYKQGSMLHIPAANITTNIQQGQNTLVFKVTNWNQLHNPAQNPGGLIYKFTIDGKCEGDYFKSHCKLWNLKDLVQGDTFWNFDDIKPGDWGKNKISLHVKSNDAYICAKVLNVANDENTYTNPEIADGDLTSGDVNGKTNGELGSILNVKAWRESDGDMIYDSGETWVYTGLFNGLNINSSPLSANNTEYLVIEWCAGNWSGNACDGSQIDNKAQTDSVKADFEISAIQQRHNTSFACPGTQPN